MHCDKCGGLVIHGGEEGELKCVQCSKRFWDGIMGYCKWIGCLSQTKGAYCSDHAVRMGFESAVESREVATESVTVTQTRSVTKKKQHIPKPLTDEETKQVQAAEKVVREAIHGPLRINGKAEIVCETAQQAIEVQRKITTAQPAYLEPCFVSFVVDMNKPEDWMSFGLTWKDRHAGFKIVNFEPEDGPDFKYTVMLEKP